MKSLVLLSFVLTVSFCSALSASTSDYPSVDNPEILEIYTDSHFSVDVWLKTSLIVAVKREYKVSYK